MTRSNLLFGIWERLRVRVAPIRQQVKNNLVGIGLRSLETLQAAAFSGDICGLFAFAQRKGLDFNLAHIPADFKPHPKEFFDPKEMQRLFKRGYAAEDER